MRVLRKSPGFTVAVVISLALGIGANTAIFSLLDAVMWRTLPVHDPAGLWAVDPHLTFSQYRTLRDGTEAADLAGYAPVRLNVGVDGLAEPTLDGQLVSGTYFPLLGVRAVVGRTIGPDDDRVPNGHPVAMIGHGYWRRRFDGTPGVVGRSLTISGTRFTIIGVTPAEFFGVDVGSNPDIFLPMMMQPTAMPASENLLEDPIVYDTWITPLARLRPGREVRAATDALSAIWAPTVPNGGKFGAPPDRLTLVPAATGLSSLRRQFSQPLQVLMAVVGIVLLIACANTATLLIARMAARRNEFAMRLGLGAGRWRLTRQLLVECLTLAVLGGAGGILLAGWATRLLVAFMSSGRSPVALDLAPSVRMLTFTTAVSLTTGIVFGLAPAWRAAATDVWPALKNLGEAVTRPRGALRSVKVLAVAQVSLSLVLLITAGLFVRSLNAMSGDSFGTPRDSVLVMPVQPRGSDQRNVPGMTARLDRQYRDLLERVRALPGVRSASVGQPTPTTPFWGAGALVTSASGASFRVALTMLYSGYFGTVGVPMVAGREFADGDMAENAPPVCVVNEAFVRKVYPGQNALGRTCFSGRRPNVHDLTGPRYGDNDVDYQIVGVVEDARYSNPTGDAPPIIYTPFLQTPTGRGQMVLYVRLGGDAGATKVRIREEVQRLDPTLPLFDEHTLQEEMDAALVQQRLVALLSTLFGGLALLLACVGLYGLLAFGVAQRRRELGIRLALGAERASVVRLVLREAMALVGMGIAIGLPLAFGAARLAGSRIAGLLFGVTATDPETMALAAALLIGVALCAAYLPAWRASRIDPLVTLKAE